MRIPETTKKVLLFIRFVYLEGNTQIPISRFRGWISLYFGGNHQTVTSYMKQIDATGILQIDPKMKGYYSLDKKKLKIWIENFKAFYPDWEEWYLFNFVDEDLKNGK